MCGAFSTQGNMRNISRIFVEKPKTIIQLRRPGLRSEENTVKIDLKKGLCDSVEWVHLLWDRDQRRSLMNRTMKFRGP
jgi:hypothetical protein